MALPSTVCLCLRAQDRICLRPVTGVNPDVCTTASSHGRTRVRWGELLSHDYAPLLIRSSTKAGVIPHSMQMRSAIKLASPWLAEPWS